MKIEENDNVILSRTVIHLFWYAIKIQLTILIGGKTIVSTVIYGDFPLIDDFFHPSYHISEYRTWTFVANGITMHIE